MSIDPHAGDGRPISYDPDNWYPIYPPQVPRPKLEKALIGALLWAAADRGHDLPDAILAELLDRPDVYTNPAYRAVHQAVFNEISSSLLLGVEFVKAVHRRLPIRWWHALTDLSVSSPLPYDHPDDIAAVVDELERRSSHD